MVKGKPQIVLTPLPSISPKQARNVRARCWDFVFQCWQEKQIGAERAPDDAKKAR